MSNNTQAHQLRLVLLDECGLFRASLGHLLTSEHDLEVVGECGTCAEALEIIQGSTVDLVLLDFNFGTERGNDFISAAQNAGYQGRFLVVTWSADVRNSAIALKLGASGIFLKSETPERLLQAIRLVGNGGTWVDQGTIQRLAGQLVDRHPRVEDQRSGEILEDRERSVLIGIVGGLTNRTIGDRIGLSESNVKNVVHRLFGRAGGRGAASLCEPLWRARWALLKILSSSLPAERRRLQTPRKNNCFAPMLPQLNAHINEF